MSHKICFRGFLVSVLMSTQLTGCGTVFDPSPYRPTIDNIVLNANPKVDDQRDSYTSASVLQFSDLSDSVDKLQALSDGYADERDAMMRQQLLFDLPMMGLAGAAIASGIYGGSKDLILGLGLGSAATAGGRAYFGPQGKIAAYNEAASSLGCASHFARGIASSLNLGEGKQALDELEGPLNQAEKALIFVANMKPSTRADLLAARDRGRNAYSNLYAALGLLSNAAAQLEAFAYTVVSSTTNKVVTGTQNLDAALALIRATPTQLPPSGKESPLSGSAASRRKPNASTALNGEDIIIEVNRLAAKAEAITKVINEKWSELPKCAIPKA